MFVRCDRALPSLTPLYDGPYRVVHRSDTYFHLAVGDREDSVSVSRLKPLLAEGPVVPAQPRRRGCPPRLKPPEPTVVPRRRGCPRKDPPPAPPPAQLRRGRSAGFDPAHLGPQGLGGGPCGGSETPCNIARYYLMIVHCMISVLFLVYELAYFGIHLTNTVSVFSA